jgi:hypothetical protein
MAKKKNQNPKHTANLKTSGEVRQNEQTEQWGESPITFIFSSFDHEGPWGIGAFTECIWQEFFRKIEDYQLMTWNEFIKDKTRNHNISPSSLSKEAIKRYEELNQDFDIETLVSFHVTGKIRFYGIRDRKFCRILWADPWHTHEKKAVCPWHKK